MIKTHNCKFKVYVRRGSKCPQCGYAMYHTYKCDKCPKTSDVMHKCKGTKKRR